MVFLILVGLFPNRSVFSTPALVTAAPSTDLTGHGKVDFLDLGIFTGCFGKDTTQDISATRCDFDTS